MAGVLAISVGGAFVAVFIELVSRSTDRRAKAMDSDLIEIALQNSFQPAPFKDFLRRTLGALGAKNTYLIGAVAGLAVSVSVVLGLSVKSDLGLLLIASGVLAGAACGRQFFGWLGLRSPKQPSTRAVPGDLDLSKTTDWPKPSPAPPTREGSSKANDLIWDDRPHFLDHKLHVQARPARPRATYLVELLGVLGIAMGIVTGFGLCLPAMVILSFGSAWYADLLLAVGLAGLVFVCGVLGGRAGTRLGNYLSRKSDRPAWGE
jgi:hypothetical protein